MKRRDKTVAPIIIAIVCLIAVSTVLFAGGDTVYRFEESSFTVHTSFWKDRTVSYADVASLVMRDDISAGKRINGYGSSRMSLGNFRNAEYGDYQLYCYNSCRLLIELRLKDGSVLVLGGRDEASSQELFETIQARVK